MKNYIMFHYVVVWFSNFIYKFVIYAKETVILAQEFFWHIHLLTLVLIKY